MPQFFGQGKPPLGVVFDSDMGSGIDDALALAMLHGFEGRNEARVISISVSNSNLQAAAFCDVVARFYSEPPGGIGLGAFARPAMPVGMALNAPPPPAAPMLAAPLAKRTPEGKPLYRQAIEKLNDTADVAALIRNALSAQFDRNAVVVVTGPATNLAQLLQLPDAAEWIAQKVQFLCVAAGNFSNGSPYENSPEEKIKRDIAAAKKVFAQWPTPIVAVGQEIGNALLFPGASIEKDFSWSPAHPVADAYRAFRPMPYDAPSTALAAVLYAVHAKENYFKVSEPGTISVQDDGRVKLTPTPEGKHRHLILDPAQSERIIQIYTEMASAKPVPRQPRFRVPQKKDAAPPKADPEKKLP
jgi:inosine-uridine nucleoside N-ribohydrolase